VAVPVFYAFVAIAVALAGVFAVALAPRLTPHLPAFLARISGRVPALSRRGPFALALLLSVLTHVCTALSGHVLVQELAPDVSLTHSLTVVSLAAVSAFFPLTVGGAGIREGAFAQLYAPLGVPGAVAVAASLALFVTQLLVSGVGGLVATFFPVLQASRGQGAVPPKDS
jgi:uncharacterized membrane protein YbhN (UPF0104 family)